MDALERDGHQCQLGYPGCLGEATEVDHIVNIATTGIARARCQRRGLVCSDVEFVSPAEDL